MSVGLAYSGDLSRDPSTDMSSEIVVTNSPPPTVHFPGMYIRVNEAKILNIILLGTRPHGSRAHKRISAKDIQYTGSVFQNLKTVKYSYKH
jgi:hypothetical protein